MGKRLKLWAVLAAVFVLAVAAGAQPAGQRPPNIVLIVSDDQGYGDLGCFGSDVVKSPHIDRLAREGVRLTSYYVGWPACGPSRGAFMTGRYPQRNGIFENIRNMRVNDGHRYTEEEYATSPEMTLGMDLREVTIPILLKRAGYRNGVFGKWDSGRARRFMPLQRGFDDFYGFSNTGIDYWTHERYGIHSIFRGNERTKEDQGTYFTDLVRREALRFLRESAGQQPFFLYVPFFAPHGASNLERTGIRPPKKYLDLYDESLPRNRREYLAAITCMDEVVGDILGALQTKGVADNTLVVFFSDNGGVGPGRTSDNGPLRAGKGTMFEGGIRVPFIARWPGRIPAGTVSNEFLTSLELLPTLVKIAGAPKPDVTLDGFDMMPILRGEAKSPRTEMFWERLSAGRGARVGNWKWVEMKEGGGLFDLAADLGEKNDLSAQRPDMLKLLQERFAAWAWEMDHALEPRGPFRNY